MKHVVIFLIKCYQILISPFFYNRCRFYPSCSHYALEALINYSIAKGLFLLIKRLLKCHPFGPSGIDLVPYKLTTDQFLPHKIKPHKNDQSPIKINRK